MTNKFIRCHELYSVEMVTTVTEDEIDYYKYSHQMSPGAQCENSHRLFILIG